MTTNPAQEAVRATFQVARTGGNALVTALTDVVKIEAWREFPSLTAPNVVIRHGSLREFIEAKPYSGLGYNADALEVLLRRSNLPGDADTIRHALDAELAPVAAHGGAREQVSATNLTKPDRDYVLARLKRDDPALAAKVMAGTITANAAAVTAGIRHRYLRVRGDDLDLAIAKLEAHYGVRLIVESSP